MILVSTDDHVIEPPDLFERHWPEHRRDEAPRLVRGDDGVDVWVFQGATMGNVGLNAVASWPRHEWGFDPIGHAEMRPGCYDMDLRVRDMDANGVLASMMFPTFGGFNGVRFAEPSIPDKELATMAIAAYNDWQIDELAGEHPGRFIPLAIGPVYDSAKLAAEIRRVAAKGCTAVSLPETPYGVDLPAFGDTEYWDPVFAACCDEDVAICLHIGGSFGLIKMPPAMVIDHLIVLAPQLSAVTTADLLLAGVLKRFPSLKVALSEGGIGWIPFFLDRLERHMWNQAWTGLEIGPPGKTPTELFRSNFLGCFITDPTALLTRDRIGIESIAWECDFPHSDSTWPTSPECLWDELQRASCSDDEIHKITWQNACRFFRFDPFTAVPRDQATVGALRARAADVDVGETSRAEYRRRYTESCSAS